MSEQPKADRPEESQSDCSSNPLNPRIAWSVQDVGEVDSTQRLARQMAAQGAPEGTTLVASKQRAGRGRLDRRWHSPEGGLYMSVILRPKISDSVQFLSLAGALAALTAVKANTGLEASLRWPNDIVIGLKKVAGVIGEASYSGDSVSYFVLGVGINCNFASAELGDLEATSTTLSDLLRRDVSIVKISTNVLESLGSFYATWQAGEGGNLIELARQNCSTIGRTVLLELRSSTIEGRCEGITDEGRLSIRIENGKSYLASVEELVRLRELG